MNRSSDEENITSYQYEDKFVGFIDILGFKDHVRRTERGELSLGQLLEATQLLGHEQHSLNFQKYGPTTCPNAPRFRQDLNFRVTQVSDCAIVSCEVSEAGAINLVAHFWKAVLRLLSRGFMCRGYICRGSLYHEGNHVIGSAYLRALDQERAVGAFKRNSTEKGTPFVELDPSVSDFLKRASDRCVRKQYQLLVKEAAGISAIFPFACIRHSPLGDAVFDAGIERARNNEMRAIIKNFIAGIEAYVDRDNPSAIAKGEYYREALVAQLVECDVVDWDIDFFSQIVPKR